MKRSELFFAFILLPLDVAMIIAAFVLAHYLRVDLEVLLVVYDIGLKEYLRYSFYLMPVWVFLLALNGLYGIGRNRNFLSEFYRILNASSVAILFLIVGIFFSRSLFFSRLIVILTWVLSIMTLALGRFAIKSIQGYLFKFGIGERKLILIGDNGISESLFVQAAKNSQLGYKVVGILCNEQKISKHGLKIIGSVEEAERSIKKYDVDEIILTDMGLARNKVFEIIQICSDNNVVFKYIPDIFAIMSRNIIYQLFGSMPVMELQPIPMEGWGRISKRIIDIVMALVAIILSSPLILIATIGVKLTSRGSIIYKQKRVGRDGRTFDFYKFRSMYQEKCDYTENGSKWTTKADEKTRITPFGLFLRKTNIDELPQFFNVLKGNMSFVGPRPELPKFVEQFQRDIPEYFRRHKVKSGITGWAQVNGLKGDTSIKERVRYDIYYIENWSIWLDLVILARTIGLVLSEAFGGKREYRTK